VPDPIADAFLRQLSLVLTPMQETISRIEGKLDSKAEKADFAVVVAKLDQKADKVDVVALSERISSLEKQEIARHASEEQAKTVKLSLVSRRRWVIGIVASVAGSTTVATLLTLRFH
jgi:hypothetical protein